MNSCELVSFVSALSCAIAKNTSDEELSLLAAVFTQLGDSLATIALTRDIQQGNGENKCPQKC